MTENKEQNPTIEIEEKGSFMLPIWIITLATMLGTGLISYSIHLYMIDKQHKANLEQITAVEFRTEKYNEYKKLIETKGLDEAVKSLNK